jgi:hypothetical protein
MSSFVCRGWVTLHVLLECYSGFTCGEPGLSSGWCYDLRQSLGVQQCAQSGGPPSHLSGSTSTVVAGSVRLYMSRAIELCLLAVLDPVEFH